MPKFSSSPFSARKLRSAAVIVFGSLLGGCALFTGLPERSTLSTRLQAIPQDDLPLEKPVVIHWDDHQIPFIEAQTDRDLAFTLGMIHAHLSLGQLETLRRIAAGRLSEIAGPFATDIDHTLRILDVGRNAEQAVKALPESTRVWLGAFVDGINHYQRQAKELPLEFELFGMQREPWTIKELLATTRVAAADVTWLTWIQMLRLTDRPDFPELWRKVAEAGGRTALSFPGQTALRLDHLLGGMGKTGSNSIALGPDRTKTGAAMMINDPHVGVMLPNLWLLAGYKSPSYHAVGIMIPGIPAIVLGRNPKIAWGGTNMHAASSDLYDATELPRDAWTVRKEQIKVRWWFDEEVEIRESPLGPILTDSPLLDWGDRPPVALRWVGHLPSDEVSALLRMNRATDFESFRRAFATFAVSGQNFLYADVDGNIGHVLAARLPVREKGVPEDIVRKPSFAWSGFRDARTLPAAYNPPSSFIASANNQPADADIPLGYFFATSDRVERLGHIIDTSKKLDLDGAKRLQQDVYLESSVRLKRAYLRALDALQLSAAADKMQRLVVDEMRAWTGHYRRDERGPVAFELFNAAFLKRYYTQQLGDQDVAEGFIALSSIRQILLSELALAEPSAYRAHLIGALEDAASAIDEFATWGAMHKMRLQHPLAEAPLIGGKFLFKEYGVSGSSDTVRKTAHRPTNELHATNYGSNARHISDLSDPDANYFVLLGGQDGWFESSTFLDQAELFERGEYVQIQLQT
ncbi:MAG: penicillin acylase family protein, partial [Myxococcota bacterium]